MKVYVKSNQYNEQPMSVVNITLDFSVDFDDFEDDRITATTLLSEDDIQLVGADGQIIEDAYDGFIESVELIANQMGIFCLHEDRSEFELDGEVSNSRYLDFCVEDKLDSNTVRFVFFIRISDHKDKHKNHIRHANQRLSQYEESGISINSGQERINPEIKRITINRQSYPTTNSALTAIRRIFQQLLDSESADVNKSK